MSLKTTNRGQPLTLTALADRFPTGRLQAIVEAVYVDRIFIQKRTPPAKGADE